MRKIEGENGNEHLTEKSCTLLYDYIEWTRTLVVFLGCGCNPVVHPFCLPSTGCASSNIGEEKQEPLRKIL